MAATDFDYILVGGGLQNGLLALALRASKPHARIAQIERAARLGGNHTWCFHAEDLSVDASRWVEPLVCKRWSAYQVVFPHLRRTIPGAYSAVTSDRLHDVVSSAIRSSDGSELLLGETASQIAGHRVELEGGRVLAGEWVIDSRGPTDDSGAGAAGYQKFVGLELRLKRPHALELPVVMDATVDQTDGFRFFYSLPLAEDRVLVEDTYFNEFPKLDREHLRETVLHYATRQGFAVEEVVREESGVLPMPWRGSLPAADGSPLVAGYRGGWFHPATGYSFPVAVRLAEWVASSAERAGDARSLKGLVDRHVSQARYCHLLNRFLFQWYAPSSRWHIFERFYRMPDPTIHRFYALRLTLADRLRLLGGRPPRGLSLGYRLRRRVRS